MKKRLFFFVLTVFGVSVSAQQTMLPDELKPFVLEHFEGQFVRSIAPNADNPKLKEVVMEDMSKIVYDSKKTVVSVSFAGEEHSSRSFLPQSIIDYLTEYYPENKVTGWQKDKKREQVTLDNGKVLYFSAKDHVIID